MNEQFDFSKVIDNLTTQIAQQAQQIAILQAVIQSMVEPANTEAAAEKQEQEPADETS